jgi:hypothetical protein
MPLQQEQDDHARHTGWPDGFVDVQITAEAKLASIVFPDDGLLAQKQTLKRQEISSS